MQMDSKEFLSVPQAALKCGVSRATMWKWVKAEKIKSFVTAGGHHRILRVDIEQLLSERGFVSKVKNEQRTILIVDDDASMRKLLKQRLRRENFKVDTAEDGFSAGIKIQKEKPDLILLDLIMEGLDGFEVCRAIKQDDALKSIKILALTGFDTPEHRRRALAQGADAFIVKGTELAIIMDQIKALLDGRSFDGVK
jgi:CheY-like chemotaxis protein/predicted DNA-binding transcriptional regulator AlpA